MLAKSTWSPAIRREHALATLARANGVGVDFVEAPADIRRLRDRGTWTAGLRRVPPRRDSGPAIVYSRSTFVPGHRNAMATRLDNGLLRRTVETLCRQAAPADVAVVVNVPWQWGATSGADARRVFDAADDWNLLLDGRRPHVREAYARIAAEADAIVVANPKLAALFPGREVDLVPNGAQSDLVAGAGVRPSGTRRMVYIGTLSERFDTALVTDVLTRLPDWTLDLYGEFRYAGHGDQPAPEFTRLLETFPGRVTWHGVLQRAELGTVLDRAGVALVPHRSRFSRGQSSMKFMDYAARGCPVVSTRWEDDLERQAPPGVWFADTADEFTGAVRDADRNDAGTSRLALAWAEEQTWERRWPLWAGAVFDDVASAG